MEIEVLLLFVDVLRGAGRIEGVGLEVVEVVEGVGLCEEGERERSAREEEE